VGEVARRPPHFLSDVGVEPTVKVPRGVTSLRAAKARYPRPEAYPPLDPEKPTRRFKCEEPRCWRQAHLTRTYDPADFDPDDHEPAVTYRLCPAHADAWDAAEKEERVADRQAAMQAEDAARYAADNPRSQTARQWRAEHGISEADYRNAPSRQDRRAEYDARNLQRRRERQEARRTAARASSADTPGSSGPDEA
jgi:hypothetical protein